jgi:hypothetical protein
MNREETPAVAHATCLRPNNFRWSSLKGLVERVGRIDRTAKFNPCNLLRSDTPMAIGCLPLRAPVESTEKVRAKPGKAEFALS